MDETVTDVSRRLLTEHSGLSRLLDMDLAEPSRLRGLSEAKVGG